MHSIKLGRCLSYIDGRDRVFLTKLLKESRLVIQDLMQTEKTLQRKLAMAYIEIDKLEETVVRLSIDKPLPLTRCKQIYRNTFWFTNLPSF